MTNYDPQLKNCRDLIGSNKDLDAQIELYRLHDSIMRARALSTDHTPSIDVALAAAGAQKFNLNIVKEIRNRLDLAALNGNPGFVSWIRKALGDSPLYAMLVGVFFSFIFSILIYFAIMSVWSLLADLKIVNNPAERNNFSIVAFSAVLAAILSIFSRAHFFADLYVYDPFLIFVNCLIKPLMACGLAIFVFCALHSKIVQITGISNYFDKGTMENTELFPSFLWALGFVVGFSERFTNDLIARTESVFAGAANLKTN